MAKSKQSGPESTGEQSEGPEALAQTAGEQTPTKKLIAKIYADKERLAETGFTMPAKPHFGPPTAAEQAVKNWARSRTGRGDVPRHVPSAQELALRRQGPPPAGAAVRAN